MKTTIKDYINENNSIINLIEEIKNYLVEYFDYNNYHAFIDNQKIGDCQLIANIIKSEFPNVIKVFGEIEVDDPYLDDNQEEQILLTHHWIEINGEIYDFSKGTLDAYIEWNDKYEPLEIDNWRYHSIEKIK